MLHVRGCLTPSLCVTEVLCPRGPCVLRLLALESCTLFICFSIIYMQFSSSPALSRLGEDSFLIVFPCFHLVFLSWDSPRRHHLLHGLMACALPSRVPLGCPKGVARGSVYGGGYHLDSWQKGADSEEQGGSTCPSSMAALWLEGSNLGEWDGRLFTILLHVCQKM